MSSNLYYNPNYEFRYARRNSLPTYEEATGQVQESVPNPIAPPSFPIHNRNEHQYLNSDRRPSYQSHALPPFDLSSRSRDDDTGQQQSDIIQDSDPVVLQTTQANLEECERERRKNGNNKSAECIGLAVLVFVGIVLVVIKMSNETATLSTDSSSWKSQLHRHHWSE